VEPFPDIKRVLCMHACMHAPTHPPAPSASAVPRTCISGMLRCTPLSRSAATAASPLAAPGSSTHMATREMPPLPRGTPTVLEALCTHCCPVRNCPCHLDRRIPECAESLHQDPHYSAPHSLHLYPHSASKDPHYSASWRQPAPLQRSANPSPSPHATSRKVGGQLHESSNKC
jgi:hypothetical protein